MALDAVSLMRARVRGTPSWPGHDPETGYVGADRSDHSQKLLADGAGHTGLLVLGRMARTRADVREAELLEDLADRALVVSDAEALGHDLLQVHPAPAHDSMHGALRPGFNDLGELRQLLRREARRVAFRPAVLEPFGASFIEAVHPVPQRLAVHAADPRGIGPAHPIQHRRKRQQTPTLVGVLGGRRKTPQLVGRKVRPHRHRCRHGTNPPAPWNQLNIERGIASESERKAVGMSRPSKTARG